MSAPAVSIVVPCYNGGRYLNALMESLAAQAFRDFEVIIVDDGSTDAETHRFLDGIGAGVRILRQENRGLPAARNAGFRAARAELVVPLDCDDLLEPAFLAEMVDALAGAPPETAFAFSHMRLVGEIEGVLPRHFNRFDQLFLNQLPYCMLIRKSAWAAVGGYDESMRAGYEDWEFNIRLASAGFVGVEVPKPLFVYHVSSGGMLLGSSAQKHGALWRRIRERHRDCYRLQQLLAIERAWRHPPRRFGLLQTVLALMLTRVVPEALTGRIFFMLLRSAHWLRMRRGMLVHVRTGRVPASAPAGTPAVADLGLEEIPSAKRDFGLVRLAVSIFLVGLATHYIGVRHLFDTLMQVDATMLLNAFALFLLQVLVVAWRFRLVLSQGGLDVPYPRALEATAFSLVANVVLFTNIAGIVYRVLVLRAPSHSVSMLVVASLVERAVVFLVLVVAALVGAAWLHVTLDLGPSLMALGAVAGLVAAGAAAIWGAARFLPEPKVHPWWWNAGIARHLKPYARDPCGLGSIVLITFVSHLVFLAAATVVALGTNIVLDPFDLAAAVSATMLVASLPISLSGWGVREMSLVWLLGLLGVAAPAALAFSVVLGLLSLLAAAAVASACVAFHAAR
jgi:GT2 family glycosyltransferase/uncharacterized membrane protein YbhN (UPF0104 family)